MTVTKNIFQSTSIKLASLYLLIIVAISLLFSFWIYRVSMDQIRRSIQHIPSPIQRLLLDDNPQLLDEIRSAQNTSVEEARNRLVYQLGMINILVGIIGATASYLFARITLKPIEEAHEAQSRFTADASHELRTPITAMRAETELTLSEPKLSVAEARRQLASNIEELDKLTALAEGLLHLSRLDNNELPRQPEPVVEIIQEAIHLNLKKAELKHQIIVVEKLLAVDVTVNRYAIVEALGTILDNAIKYSPEHSQITVRSTKHAQKIFISIKDSGMGIRPPDQKHIFDRFYRADTSRNKETAEGYGIGLSIAKAAVSPHHGTITLKSSPGKGSEFTVQLPL